MTQDHLDTKLRELDEKLAKVLDNTASVNIAREVIFWYPTLEQDLLTTLDEYWDSILIELTSFLNLLTNTPHHNNLEFIQSRFLGLFRLHLCLFFMAAAEEVNFTMNQETTDKIIEYIGHIVSYLDT